MSGLASQKLSLGVLYYQIMQKDSWTDIGQAGVVSGRVAILIDNTLRSLSKSWRNCARWASPRRTQK